MSRTITLTGFCFMAAALGGLQLASLVSDRTPTLGQVVSMIASRRSGRWLLLAGWLWLGWHLFARSHVA
ncbi:MAG TPA: DUF6186 family protein [Acidimicrobiales bacterium]|nr:DUF6186 family protein [Acidimicrobiales bacterium]